MSDILRTEIHLLNNGIKFSSKSENNPEIISDYYPPLGNNEGYKPLELFLISFGTCASGTILPLLKRMQKSIELYTMQVEGIRKTEQPTGFSKITQSYSRRSTKSNKVSGRKILPCLVNDQE